MEAYSQVRLGVYLRACLGVCLRASWELTGSVQSSRLGVCHRVQLGASLRAWPGVYLGAYSQAGWECAIECNWEHP